MTDFDTRPLSPSKLSDAHCYRCGQRTAITWKTRQSAADLHTNTLPHCTVCNAVSWEAMAHLSRREGCYCRTKSMEWE